MFCIHTYWVADGSNTGEYIFLILDFFYLMDFSIFTALKSGLISHNEDYTAFLTSLQPQFTLPRITMRKRFLQSGENLRSPLQIATKLIRKVN